MPPKMQEQQHRRDGSPDNNKKGGIGEKAKEQKEKVKGGGGREKDGSDDESTMEKLKDKMGGMFGGGGDDGKKEERKEGKKDDKKENKGRSRSRSRSRSKNRDEKKDGKKEERKDGRTDDKKENKGRTSRSRSRSKSRERRRSGSKSPQRQGQGHGQQQAMKMGTAGAGAGAGAGAAVAATKAGDHRANSPSRPAQNQRQGHNGGGGSSHKSRTKRGLCWPRENKQDDPSRFTRPGSKVSWYYNWSPHPTRDTGNLQFIPMQWNAGGIKELATNVDRNSDAKTMMAFNEPELGDQANMSPDEAAGKWLEFVEPLRKKGVRCGSPAISNSGQAVGWMKDFWGKVKRGGSDVDFWCFHWYGPELGPFYDYIWSTHHQLDPSKKAWITEFACTNWDKANPLPKDHVLNFAKESFKYLDSLDWVERYCWFAPTRDIGNVGKFARMYNDEGNLTDVGKAFRGDD